MEQFALSLDYPFTTLPEPQARELLVVRAFEESDRDGRLLSAVERQRLATGNGSGGDLVRRAQALLKLLRSRVREVDVLLSVAGAVPSARWVMPLAVLVVFFLGVTSNALGSSATVSVLALPLIGALAWNLAMYVVLALAALRAGRIRSRAAAGAGLVQRLAAALAGARLRRQQLRSKADAAAVVAEAGAGFARLWVEAAHPLIGARMRRALHYGALALVAGMVVGMYLRGIAFEYRAQWSSTFLSPKLVDSLLGTLLWPASRLAGIDLPAASTLQAPASGHAAPWIHLWALTAALFAIMPRLALGAMETVRVLRLREAVPIDLGAPYWRRLLSASAGSGICARILPFSAPLSPRSADRLRALLNDAFGARAEVSLAPWMEYGTNASAPKLPEDDARVVVVFAIAQTPELEVHARFLIELAQRLGNGVGPLCVVDAGGFAERFGAERLGERKRAWDLVLREAGLPALHLNLADVKDERELELAVAALRNFERTEQLS